VFLLLTAAAAAAGLRVRFRRFDLIVGDFAQRCLPAAHAVAPHPPSPTTKKNQRRWDDYCRGGKVYGILKGLLTGFVPALLIMLWQALAMPRLVFLAAQSEARHFSLSQLDLRMGAVYFLWSALNFFVGGVVGSTVLAQVPELVSKPFETPQRLGYALPASAKFFLTYLILRTFMTVPLRFLIAQPGVWQAWIRFGISLVNKNIKDDKATSRALYMRTAIRSPRYGVEFGGNMCAPARFG
jgi:hypothetical protein